MFALGTALAAVLPVWAAPAPPAPVAYAASAPVTRRAAAPAEAQTVRPQLFASLRVYAHPREGRRVGWEDPYTAYAGRTRLWVRARRAGWIKIANMDAPGGSGWVRDDELVRPAGPLRRRVLVDVSARRLSLLGGAHPWSVTVGVGTPSTPTPTGTFQITDRLPGSRYRGAYGRWVLILSAYGDRAHRTRMAIHGRPPAAAALNGSLGCVRVPERALRRLARAVGPGTPVRIVA